MSLTIAGLLRRRDLDLRLRVGDADAEVSWVHISDLVDPTPYLDRGSLVLTTGLGLAAASREWAPYAARLVHAGACAVGFGVGLRHDRVPDPLLTAARAYGLPVVEVPKSTRFDALLRAVVDARDAAEAAGQRLALDRQSELLRAATAAPLHRSVVTRLGEQLDAWVMVLSRDVQILAVSPAGARQHLERVRLELSRGDSGARGFDLSTDWATLLPVGPMERPVGWLVVGRAERLTTGDRRVVDAAVALLRLDIARAAELLESERRERSAVLTLLVDGQPEQAIRVADTLGLPMPDPPVRVALLTTDGGLRSDLMEVLENNRSLQIGSGLVAEHRHDQVVVVLPSLQGDLGVLQEALSSVSGSRGVASEPIELGALPRTLGRLGALLKAVPPGSRQLSVAGDVAQQGLLAQVDGERLRAWAEAALAPLRTTDRQRVELLDTVRAYLGNVGNGEATAAELGIHRRTLGYRLARVEAALGRSLADATVRAELWLAVQVHDSH